MWINTEEGAILFDCHDWEIWYAGKEYGITFGLETRDASNVSSAKVGILENMIFSCNYECETFDSGSFLGDAVDEYREY